MTINSINRCSLSLARFAGPATAVDYPRLLTARLGVRAPRTAGEGVAEAAWRLQRLVLPPGQLAALGSRHRLAYVYGPSGTGTNNLNFFAIRRSTSIL